MTGKGTNGLPCTKRHYEILSLMAEGLNREQIAARLFIEPRTVRCHLNTIYKRLGVSACGNPGWRAVAIFVANDRITTLVRRHRVSLLEGHDFVVNGGVRP